MKNIEFRLLRADEIEVRPQSIKNGKANMLLYMNSRVVTELLDETVGSMNWTSEFYEVNNKLVCKIGIWDEDKNMFIYKSDTGSESNIEAEKGQFSDCYKRCLSRWGVTELYSSPQITIDDDGYGCKGYYVRLIKYDEYSRKITEIHICNRFDKEVFNWKIDNGYNDVSQNTDNKNNYELLVEFCKKTKSEGADQETLKKFFKYYEGKSKNWNGTFNAKSLFDKWVERSKQSRPITQNSNDMSIQEYDERTFGADSESFYF